MEITYSIDLGNGTVLNGLTLNGNNYVSQEEISEEIFDGMGNVIITGSDGSTYEMEKVELVYIQRFSDGYYFVLHELSESEIKEAATDAQVLFTALMTDTLLEEE